MIVSFQVSFRSDTCADLSFPMCRFESGVTSSTYAVSKRQGATTQTIPPKETTDCGPPIRATKCRLGFPSSSLALKKIIPACRSCGPVNEFGPNAATARGVGLRVSAPRIACVLHLRIFSGIRRRSHSRGCQNLLQRASKPVFAVVGTALGSPACCKLSAHGPNMACWARPRADSTFCIKHRNAIGPGSACVALTRAAEGLEHDHS
jgi:hypothetical protein